MLLPVPSLSNNTSLPDLQQQQHQQRRHRRQLHHPSQYQYRLQHHPHHNQHQGLDVSKFGDENETSSSSLELSGLVVPANPSLYCPNSDRPDSASAGLDINAGFNLDDVDLELDDLASLDSLDSLDSASASSSISTRSVRSLQNNPVVFEGFVDPGSSFGSLKNPPRPLPLSTTAAATRSDLMHGGGWLCQGQVPTKLVPAGRASHNRESSLSSLGSTSAGPASPYSQTTSNPHIAVTDSPGDVFSSLGHHGLSGSDEFNYQLVKSFPHTQDTSIFFPNYPTYQAPYSNALVSNRLKGDRSMLPPPDLSAGPSARSRPVSVASSVASDSPATPSATDQQHQQQQPEGDRRRRIIGLHTLPKLDRTMTDVYGDELYNPNFASSTGNSPSHHATQIPISPNHEMFAQRLQAANSQHLSAVQSPVVSVSRGRSPFRNGSPLAPPPALDFGSAMASTSAHQARFNSTQMPESHSIEQDALRQQMTQGMEAPTPQTISPKDAMIEYEPESDTNFPLFPQPSTAGAGTDASTELTEDQINKAVAEAVQAQAHGAAQGYDGMALDTTGFEYATGLQVPHQYPFVSQAPAASIAPIPLTMSMADVGQQCSSSNNSSSSSSSSSSSRRPDTNSSHRPDDAVRGAECGTYTCTYHGCTQRFDTPVLLQKHKREGHRQVHGLGGSGSGSGSTVVHRVDLGSGLVQLNTQAGPHRCDRINPSTGKPCNTVFSRPYDLTRHEDTIHNARKQKVRCDHCTEEKTFSRADALTRHYRVCHPDIPVPGKFRRRAMRGSPQAQAHY